MGRFCFTVLLLFGIQHLAISQEDAQGGQQTKAEVPTSVSDNEIPDSLQFNIDTLPQPKSSFFLELGGITGIYSLNFEQIFYSNKTLQIGGRAGLSFLSLSKDLGTDYFIPLGAFVSYGKRKWIGGFGTGIVIYNYKVRDFFYEGEVKSINEVYNYFELSLRYNFYKRRNGWFMKVAYTPSLHYFEGIREETKFYNWGGLSIGYSF